MSYLSLALAHDHRLLELLRDEAKAAHQLEGVRSRITYAAKYPERYNIDNLNEQLSAATTALTEARNAVLDHETDYTGWNRYYLVTSSAGHVHRSTECYTCSATTTFALLPTMSAHEVADLVAAVGPALCSVCFPDAPVEWQDSERITSGVAMKLFNDGPAAFREALRKLREKRQKKAAEEARLAAEGRRKRPLRLPHESPLAHYRRYPASEGWYG